MTYLLEWVKQIFTICILTGIVSHLAPGDKYQMYIRFAGSLMIILVCINPVTTFLTGEDNIARMLQDLNCYWNSEIHMNYGNMSFDKEAKEDKSYYEEYVIQYIENRVLDYDMYPVGTEILIDWDEASKTYGTLQKITVNITHEKNKQVKVAPINTTAEKEKTITKQMADLKAELADYYGINPVNVNVYESR